MPYPQPLQPSHVLPSASPLANTPLTLLRTLCLQASRKGGLLHDSDLFFEDTRGVSDSSSSSSDDEEAGRSEDGDGDEGSGSGEDGDEGRQGEEEEGAGAATKRQRQARGKQVGPWRTRARLPAVRTSERKHRSHTLRALIQGICTGQKGGC